MHTTGKKRDRVIRLAFKQIIEERKEYFYDIIADIMEDIALGKAIEDGLNSERVSKQEVLNVLKAK